MPSLPWGLARFYPLKAPNGYRWDFPLHVAGTTVPAQSDGGELTVTVPSIPTHNVIAIDQ